MRSVPISHSITEPLARSIGLGFTGAERGKALTNAGGLSGPPFGVHYTLGIRHVLERVHAERGNPVSGKSGVSWGNPVSVHHSFPKRGKSGVSSPFFPERGKSGVSSPFFPEKMHGHRISPAKR